MKKLLVLLLCVPLIFSCGENNKSKSENENIIELLIDELTVKGNKNNSVAYYQGEMFNGIGFDVYKDNHSRQFEWTYKNGKIIRWQYYDENGKVTNEERDTIDGKPEKIPSFTIIATKGNKELMVGKINDSKHKWIDERWHNLLKMEMMKLEYSTVLLYDDDSWFGEDEMADEQSINWIYKRNSWPTENLVCEHTKHSDGNARIGLELLYNGKWVFEICWDEEGNEIDCE